MHSLFKQFEITDQRVRELMDLMLDNGDMEDIITYAVLDDGSVEIDVPGFNKEHLSTTVSKELLDVTLKNDDRDEEMKFSVTLPDNTERVQCSIKDGIMTVSFVFRPCDIDVVVE